MPRTRTEELGFLDHRQRPNIGPEQVLTLTLPVIGTVTGSVIVSARLVRSGLRGRLEAVRDLIAGGGPNERSYPAMTYLTHLTNL